MNTCEKAIGRARSEVALFLFLKRWFTFSTIWCFSWGTAALVLRGAIGIPLPPLLWAAVGVLASAALALVLTLRHLPSRTVVRALLDKIGGHKGLLMAGEVADIGNWSELLPSIETPSMRWRNLRLWALLAAGAVFVISTSLVPRRFTAISPAHSLEISKDVEKLSAQIETLKEEEILERDKAESLEANLAQLLAEASGEDPVKTWEALDHLENVVTKAAQEAAEDALGQTEELTEAETLAEGLAEGAAGMNPDLLAEAMKELAGMVAKAAEDTESFKRRLSRELQESCQNGSLTQEQLDDLLRALRLCKGDMAQCLQRLCEMDLIDLEFLKLCEDLGQCDGAGLAAFLDENAGKAAICDLVDLWCQGLPGRGGVTRGRGDAPLTWSDPSTEEEVTFKEETLPPATVAALKESMLVGVGVGAPSVSEISEFSKPGALTEAAAGGGEAHTHTILPRHRGTVKRYFERQKVETESL